MNRIIGYQQDLLGGPEVAVWARGKPPAEPRARRRDPKTSKDAAIGAKELAANHRALILAALQQHGPASKDQIAARTRLTGVQVGRRLAELRRLELIEDAKTTARSAAGRQETVWRAA